MHEVHKPGLPQLQRSYKDYFCPLCLYFPEDSQEEGNGKESVEQTSRPLAAEGINSLSSPSSELGEESRELRILQRRKEIYFRHPCRSI